MASSAAQISFCNTTPASFRKPTFRPSTTVFSGQRLYNTTPFRSWPSSASLRLSSNNNNCNGWSIGPFGVASEKVMGIYLGTKNSAFGPMASIPCFPQKTERSVSVNAQSDTVSSAEEERVVVLVIGGGGREHALCYAMKRSPSCDAVFCAPGNAGISNAGDATCIPDLDVFDSSAVISFCRKWDVRLVVVGPEAPLVSGLVNDLVKAGIPAFGPSSEASALEGSKNFMKSLCDKYGIPTAKYKTFADASDAKQYIQEQGAPIVVKADGLAAGKGVIVAMTLEQAYEAVDSMLVKGVFGSAGCRVIVEEYLEGEEASFFALVDGENAIPLESAQDHKRVGDGDTGPNTGGMGAYSPAPVLTKELQDLVMNSIILPTVKGMSAEGCKFVGVLYAGLMIEKKSGLPKLIEYNVRFGDPECQVLMVRLECDLAQVLLAACRGKLSEVSLNWSPGSAMVVVMASKGYPGSYRKGSLIRNLDEAENVAPFVKIFHAGTAQDSEGNFIATGGRVLGVTAKGKDLQEARDRAYQAVEAIDWSGGFHRQDIAGTMKQADSVVNQAEKQLNNLGKKVNIPVQEKVRGETQRAESQDSGGFTQAIMDGVAAFNQNVMKLGHCGTGPAPGGEPGSSSHWVGTFDVDFTGISTYMDIGESMSLYPLGVKWKETITGFGSSDVEARLYQKSVPVFKFARYITMDPF